MAKKPNNSPEITAKKKAEGKNLGGRPKFSIDYSQLEKLCAIFCNGEECASILGCTYETLNLRLQEDYQQAVEENPDETPNKRYNGFPECFKKLSSTGKASLRREQFMMAVGERNNEGKIVRPPNKTMLIWMGKNHLGQTDRSDVTTKDKPLPGAQASGFDFTKLSENDFLELGKILVKSKNVEDKRKTSVDKVH